MDKRISNLFVRTASGAVYVALMVASVFTEWVAIPLVFLIVLCGLSEFSKLSSANNPEAKNNLAFWIIASLLVCNFFIASSADHSSILIYISAVIAVITLIIPEFLNNTSRPLENIATSVFSLVWIVYPVCILFFLWIPYNNIQVLAYFILIWAADTFAYLGGSVFGKHKIAERISPGKTWEGFFISCIITVLLAIGLSHIPFFKAANLPVWKWIVFSMSVEVLGLMGDLLESLFKRKAGVKDSGKILPGHGGVLDRFDSILVSAVPLYLLCL